MQHTPACLLAAAFGLLSLPALAAAQPAAQPAAQATPSAGSSQPQATTAAYGDWTLRCVMLPVPAPAGSPAGTPTGPAVKHCEIEQGIIANGQQTPVAQIAVGPDISDGSMRFAVQLPIGSWLPSAPVFKLGDKGTPLQLAFKRCVPNACLADAALPDALASAMQGSKGQGQLTFQVTAGRDIILPTSFNGFDAAFAALQDAM